VKEVEVGYVFYNVDKTCYGKVVKIAKTKIHYHWYNLSNVEIHCCKVDKKRFYKYLYTSWEEITPVEQELF
jgi:hypothetical protein